MSQFKVGPTKFRNGDDCSIMEILPDGKLAIKNEYDGEWFVQQRFPNGRAFGGTTREDSADVLPNVEPEWREYSLFRCGNSSRTQVIESRHYRKHKAEPVLLRYLYAPGHPIQIISGDVVDAREKDE